VRDAGTEEHEVAFFLQSNFPIWKHQNEMTPDEVLRVRTELGGDHSSRLSPLAWVCHLSSTSPVRKGLFSPGMKCPRNQPRVFFEASTTFPKRGVGESAVMGAPVPRARLLSIRLATGRRLMPAPVGTMFAYSNSLAAQQSASHET
jgi:hypothetical protein